MNRCTETVRFIRSGPEVSPITRHAQRLVGKTAIIDTIEPKCIIQIE